MQLRISYINLSHLDHVLLGWAPLHTTRTQSYSEDGKKSERKT